MPYLRRQFDSLRKVRHSDLDHRTASDYVSVIIETHGKTIPSSVLPKFFDLFSVEEASTPGKDLGLGPQWHTVFCLCSAPRSTWRIGMIRWNPTDNITKERGVR